MNKIKTMIALGAVLAVGMVFAGPHGPGPGGHHPGPAVHHGGHHHGAWGRGGRNFWPGFVGGFVGGVVAHTVCEPVAVTTPVVTTPVVVTQPTVITTTPVVTTTTVVQPVTTVQNVWVEGRYVDQVLANGTTVRTWQPGHYEQRTVTVR